MADNTRYTGLDGKIQKMTIGTAIVGDDTTALADGWYQTKTVLATGTGLPVGAEAGYVFIVDGNTITPATGEEVYPLTFTDWCFIRDASLATDKAEIDVTLPCDEVSVFEAGRSDVSGSFNGIFTDNAGWLEFQNKTLPTNVQDATGASQTISEVDESTIYLRIDKNKEDRGSYNEVFYLFPAVITNTSNESNTDGGTAQTFSANYRVASAETKAQLFVRNKA